MEKSKLFTSRIKFVTVDASVGTVEDFNIYLFAKEFMKEHGFSDRSKYDFEIDENRGLIHIYILWKDVEL